MSNDPSELIKKERLPTLWCPGCGIGIVFHQMTEAFAAAGMNHQNTSVVSGIGCTGRIAGYFDVDSVHTTHGRAIPVAEGIANYRPDLHVVVASGDGDLTSIGGNHFLHSSRRDTNLTVIMVNNEIYGMTGGQTAPTTQKGRITQTAPVGAETDPINVQGIITSNPRHFYARTSVYHIPHMKKCLQEALAWKGFSLVDIQSSCPERLGKMNKMRSPGDMILAFKDSFKIKAKPEGLLKDNQLGIIKKDA
ncbi:thiamine pyrophosphate-dependent enzyme [Patescibacteria group bacterium]